MRKREDNLYMICLSGKTFIGRLSLDKTHLEDVVDMLLVMTQQGPALMGQYIGSIDLCMQASLLKIRVMTKSPYYVPYTQAVTGIEAV